MNPLIRYPDQSHNANAIKFSYDEMKTVDRGNSQSKPNDSSKFSSQMAKNQTAASQPMLLKHKSNTADNHFYQQANFTQSYRLQSNPFSAFSNHQNTSYKTNKSVNQDSNSIYKSTNYVNHREESNKFESANDFFTVAAESIRNQEKFKSQLRNTQHIPTQKIQQNNCLIQQQNSCLIQQKTISQRKQNSQQMNDPKYEAKSDQCEKCQLMKCQNQRIIVFMRQQLEIGAKQFTDRMNKIIIQQAKQIKDLRKSLINNQKIIINLNKNSQNQPHLKIQRSVSPGRAIVKQRSPSKLSLTKSNTSISTNNVSRQKITMVSKQLSPSKTSLNNNAKGQQKSLLIHQKMSSTIQVPNHYSLTSQEIQGKIKRLEEHIQLFCKLEHERNQKTFLLNKKVQMLQKGIISFLGSKTHNLKVFLNQWILSQQDRLNQLYQQMKIISSRVGSMALNPSNPPLKQINSTNFKNTQNLFHSNPSIMAAPNLKEQLGQFNMSKITIKLKRFSSEIDDLKQIVANIQTKEFKYDNFQIQSLKKIISQVHSEMRKLDKAKEQISGQLVQNEQKLQKVIEMSKFSHIGSHTYIYPSQNNQNQYLDQSTMNKISKANIMKNNSVQIGYSQKKYETGQKMNDGTKSIKSQIPGKFETTQAKSILPKFMNMMGNKKHSEFDGYSHSQFNGFAGEESGFSQYAEESLYNNNAEREQYREQNYENEEQSFERSSQQKNEEQSQDEEDFFYRVDLSSSKKVSQNVVNNQRSGYSKQKSEGQRKRGSQNNVASSTINRFMSVIEYRQNKPLRIEIDETGYIKSADNGMYIVDRNMDGFDLSRQELEWLRQNGVIILEK